ncbi:MAG: hypothetical protein GY801_52815 [bacterium]|nr:hypothetical protein [bacterium]
MVTKELVKHEIDRLQDEYLEVVYKMIKGLEMPLLELENDRSSLSASEQAEWEAFVERYAGCMEDAPIERGAQGVYENREELR